MRTTSQPFAPQITFLDLHRESKKDKFAIAHRRVDEPMDDDKLNKHLERAAKREKKCGVRSWG